MKTVKFALILTVALGFAGCSPSTTSSSSTTTVTYANTSDATYLPLAKGNRWTFSDGSYLLDEGLDTQVCCGSPWLPLYPGAEDVAYFDTSGKFLFDMLWVYAIVPGTNTNPPTLALFLVGFGTGPGPVIVTGLPPVPVGINSSIPGLAWVVNQTPVLGQAYFDAVASPNSTATIIATNGTQPYSSEEIKDVIQVSMIAPILAGPFQPQLAIYATGTYSLAYGVGFTRIPGPNGAVLSLTSFTVATP